jgi:PAS domain-containing protein
VAHVDLDRLPDATVVVAGDGTIEAVNDRARALLWLDDAAVGRPFDEVVDLVGDDGRPCAIGRTPAGTGRSPEHEFTVRHPGGLERCLAIAVRWSDRGFVVLACPSV